MKVVGQMRQQIREGVNQAHEFLEKAASASQEEAQEFHAQAREKLAQVRENFEQLRAHCPVKVAAKDIDASVHDNPWKAVGITAVASLIVGVLLGRK